MIGKQKRNKNLRADDRGIANQLDLSFATVIITIGFGVFVLLGLALVSGISEGEPEKDVSAQRGAAMLADDYLVASPANTTLDRDCVIRFFEKNPSPDCGHNTAWGSDSYLTDSLPVEDHASVNVTIETLNGDIIKMNGQKMALGSTMNDDQEGVHVWKRYVYVDANNDGSANIYRLIVRRR